MRGQKAKKGLTGLEWESCGGGGLLLLREQSPKLFTGEGREVVGMFTVKQHHNKTIMWMLQLFNG